MRWAAAICWVSAAAVARAGPLTATEVARARQVAALVDVAPMVERLMREPAPADVAGAVARLELRADVLAELARLGLLVDGTLAQLQREQFAASAASELIRQRHGHAIATWNVAAVLVGNSASVAGTALQFGDRTHEVIGDGLIIGGAVLATVFSIVALARRERDRAPLSITTNFLAGPLGRAPTADSALPPPIRRYLDAPLAGEPASLRAQLVAQWVRQGSVSFADTPAARRRLQRLSSPITRGERVPAAVLDARADMLADLRARVAGLAGELQLLLRLVRAGAVTTASASPRTAR